MSDIDNFINDTLKKARASLTEKPQKTFCLCVYSKSPKQVKKKRQLHAWTILWILTLILQCIQCKMTTVTSALVKNNMKIFQISFGCSGGSSFVKYFRRFIPKEKVAFWKYNGKMIGEDIMSPNYQKKVSIFTGIPSSILYFGDMKLGEHTKPQIGCEIVKEMDRTFPNSIFIMNVRPLSQWLTGMMYAWHKNSPQQDYEHLILHDIGSYFKYNCCVKDYFQKQEKNKLIIFDIEKDDFAEFKSAFFNISGIELHGTLPRVNHNARHTSESFQNKNEQSVAVLFDNLCEFWVY